VNLLLDSHALLWALHDPARLNPAARAAIEDAGNSVLYSAGSVWELELKASKGKLSLPQDWVTTATSTGFVELPVTGQDAAAGARLPWIHNDPFDRLFVAQAMRHGFKLATRDAFIKQYAVDVFSV
jgi:PIN domain nuclease of toxin-antitoxin system